MEWGLYLPGAILGAVVIPIVSFWMNRPVGTDLGQRMAWAGLALWIACLGDVIYRWRRSVVQSRGSQEQSQVK